MDMLVHWVADNFFGGAIMYNLYNLFQVRLLAQLSFYLNVMFEHIIDILLENFDISYCIAVNIATYVIIKCIDDINGKKIVPRYCKRIILLLVIIVMAVIYHFVGVNIKVIIDSAILAPVSWSWIFKPLCGRLNIDYRKVEDVSE